MLSYMFCKKKNKFLSVGMTRRREVVKARTAYKKECCPYIIYRERLTGINFISYIGSNSVEIESNFSQKRPSNDRISRIPT